VSDVAHPDPVAENPLALEEQVCFALVVAARSVVSVYRPVLERLGLTHPQYLVMLALWQYAPVAAKDLCRMLQLDPGTLSPLLKRLQEAGLIRRERDPADGRSYAIALTEAGVALRTDAELVPGQIVARLGMPLPDLIEMREMLTRVIAAVNEPGDG
jgi:MarR family transcriptional regulator, organic hydroperoxide resistance regulator